MAGKKLLVADDSLTIQKVIRLALSNDGYDIHAVSNGDDASEQLTLFQPLVVLVDVSLPDKSAVELKKEYDFQSHGGAIKFVLMSNSFDQINEDEITRAQFHGRLVKPFDPAHLRQVLNEVLSSGTTTEPSAAAPYTQPSYSPPSFSPDDDIKQMTDSTMKLSGLDTYQWSVQETASAPTFLGEKTLAGFQNEEPTLNPTPLAMDNGDTTFRIDALDAPSSDSFPASAPSFSSDFVEKSGLHLYEEGRNSPPPFRTQVEAQSVLPITTEQMEKILREQLQATLETMAHKLLPDMAERIIRQEIHRMLSDPPGEASQ